MLFITVLNFPMLVVKVWFECLKFTSTLMSFRVLVDLAIPCDKPGPQVFQGFTVGFHPRSWELVSSFFHLHYVCLKKLCIIIPVIKLERTLISVLARIVEHQFTPKKKQWHQSSLIW